MNMIEVETEVTSGCDAYATSVPVEDGDKNQITDENSKTESNNVAESAFSDFDVFLEDIEVEPFIKIINNLQCPFSWESCKEIKNYGDYEIDLLVEFEEMFEETKFRFRRFIVYTIMCYHNFFRRLIDDSFKNLRELERMLVNTSKRDSSDELFHNINAALYHVVHSCRVYLYHLSGERKQALQLVPKITSYDDMSDINKAGLWAIRAAVYAEHGFDGVTAATHYIEKAIALDPKNAHWHFMKGTYLGRLRRMEQSIVVPTVNEVRALETALKLKEDPAFIAFTAEVYMEVTKNALHLYKDKLSNAPPNENIEMLYERMNKLNSKSADLFRKSVDLRPKSAHLLFRCGKGLMRLPEPHQDLDLAYKYLRKGLELSPDSSFGNHAMAIYKEKFGKNPESALKYLEISVSKKNFQAAIELSRVNFIINENVDELIEELQDMLKTYVEPPKRYKILGELVCCFLFLDFNLVSACVYIKEMFRFQSKWIISIYLFRSGILPFSEAVPLINIIASEIKRMLRHQKTTEDEKNTYKKFIHFILVENVFFDENIPENLRKIYLKDLFGGLDKRRTELCRQKKKREKKNYDRGTVEYINYGSNKRDREYQKYYKNDEQYNREKNASEWFHCSRRVRERNSEESDDGRSENERKHRYNSDEKRDRRDKKKDSEENRSASDSSEYRKSKNRKKNGSKSEEAESDRSSDYGKRKQVQEKNSKDRRRKYSEDEMNDRITRKDEKKNDELEESASDSSSDHRTNERKSKTSKDKKNYSKVDQRHKLSARDSQSREKDRKKRVAARRSDSSRSSSEIHESGEKKKNSNDEDSQSVADKIKSYMKRMTIESDDEERSEDNIENKNVKEVDRERKSRRSSSRESEVSRKFKLPARKRKSRRSSDENSQSVADKIKSYMKRMTIESDDEERSEDNIVNKNVKEVDRERKSRRSSSRESEVTSKSKLSARERKSRRSSSRESEVSRKFKLSARERKSRRSSSRESEVTSKSKLSARERKSRRSSSRESEVTSKSKLSARERKSRRSSSRESEVSRKFKLSARERKSRRSSSRESEVSRKSKLSARERKSRRSLSRESRVSKKLKLSVRERSLSSTTKKSLRSKRKTSEDRCNCRKSQSRDRKPSRKYRNRSSEYEGTSYSDSSTDREFKSKSNQKRRYREHRSPRSDQRRHKHREYSSDDASPDRRYRRNSRDRDFDRRRKRDDRKVERNSEISDRVSYHSRCSASPVPS